MENDVDGKSHRNERSFAVGQAMMEHHPELLSEKGSFASGQAQRVQPHQGTFAEGQEGADPHPEVLENRGGFAADQRRLAGTRDRRRGATSFS